MKPRNIARAGFTLIELLAVIAIIAILMMVLIPVLMGSEDDIRAGNTDAFISQLESVISEYALESGGPPLSSFDAKMTAVENNKSNEGAEMLVLKLFAKDRAAPNLSDSRLGNTDNDASKKSQTSFTNPDLFEILDDWGNPIAYIHRSDYGKTFAYTLVNVVSGDTFDCTLKAVKNPETGDPYNKGTYQLISAGPDGIFGPDPDNDDHIDDITNYN